MPSSKNTSNGSKKSSGKNQNSQLQQDGNSTLSGGQNSRGASSTSSKANTGQSRNDEQDSDERTPLLRRDQQEGSDNAGNGQSNKDDDDDDDDDDNEDEITIISDLGDFSIQPKDLSDCLSDKNVDGLLKLAGNNDSSKGGTKSLLDALQTDESKGLSNDQYSEEGSEERIRIYGKNKLPEREMKSFLRFLWEAFCDKVLIILTIAAGISFALGMWQDFGPQHDPDEPRVNWVEGVAISEQSLPSLPSYRTIS
jgi:magnesium-transporting ATPase (P-type)